MSSRLADAARRAGPIVVVLLLAAGARLACWSAVFPEGFHGSEVRLLGDGDVYYHSLRAERIAQDWPRVPWFDPLMNWPRGYPILWPPLFDHLIATTAVISTGGHPTHAALSRAAALVPAALGVAWVGLTGLASEALIGGAGWPPGLLVALLPAALEYGALGRADQHVMELLLFGAVACSFLYAWRADAQRWPRSIPLGGSLALAFWNWQGSALYLLWLAALVASWNVLAPREDDSRGAAAAALFRGCAIGTAVLATSLALCAPDQLRQATVLGVSGFHVLLLAATAAGAGGLHLLGSAPLGRPGRLVATAACGAAVLAVVLALPPARASVLRGWAALARGNAWYRTIVEFEPLLLSGLAPATADVLDLARDLGLLPLGAVAGVIALRRAWPRAAPGERPALVVLASWGVTFVGLTLWHRRFLGYALAPMAILSWLAVREAALASSRARRIAGKPLSRSAFAAAGVVLLLAPALPTVAGASSPPPDRWTDDLVPELAWLRTQPVRPGHEAVLAEWAIGHAIEWFAGRPVVTNGFGTDGGDHALEDAAAVYHARRAEEALSVLGARRAGYLLVGYPLDEIFYSHPFAPPGTPLHVHVERSLLKGRTRSVDPELASQFIARLYFFDGAADGFGSLRLVHESAQLTQTGSVFAAQFKVFDVVTGAEVLVRGADPGATVSLTIVCRTHRGREFEWSATSAADGQGRALFRVPYATGSNGAVWAGPAIARTGTRRSGAPVPEHAVLNGELVRIEL